MKSNECPIKTRVGRNLYGSIYRGETITEVIHRPNGDMVAVEWDHGQVETVAISTLMPENELDKEVAKSQAEKLRYEQEFAAVAASIKIKADAAAALINEAQELADTIGQEARFMGDACDLLQEALDSSGWYLSTANC